MGHLIKFKPENNIAPPLYFSKHQDNSTGLIKEELSTNNFSFMGASSAEQVFFKGIDENIKEETIVPTESNSLTHAVFSKSSAKNTTYTGPNLEHKSEKQRKIKRPKISRVKSEN